MKVKTVNVRAGRTIPHPLRSFANVSTQIELCAEIEDGDDADDVIGDLRIKTEQILHTHQEQVCESIKRGEEIETTTNRIQQLEEELETLKKRQSDHQHLLFASSEVKEAPRRDWDDEY